MITFLKETFSTIHGQSSFVRFLVYSVMAPFIAIFWIEAGYIALAGKTVAIDGNVVALAGTVGSIVAAVFVYARSQEAKDPPANC